MKCRDELLDMSHVKLKDKFYSDTKWLIAQQGTESRAPFKVLNYILNFVMFNF